METFYTRTIFSNPSIVIFFCKKHPIFSLSQPSSFPIGESNGLENLFCNQVSFRVHLIDYCFNSPPFRGRNIIIGAFFSYSASRASFFRVCFSPIIFNASPLSHRRLVCCRKNDSDLLFCCYSLLLLFLEKQIATYAYLIFGPIAPANRVFIIFIVVIWFYCSSAALFILHQSSFVS